jgi:anthranilate synthase component 1
MAREIEPSLNLPPNRSELPEAVAQRCPGAVIVRHGGSEAAPDRAYVVGESAEVRDEILACLQSFGELRRIVPSRPAPMLMELLEDDPSWFENAVQRVHQYLAAGDVFQVNLSRAWAAFFSAEPDPCELYRALRHTNPAPFAGLMNWAGQTLLSSSPERLVQLRGRRLQTRPIAGTRPRGRDARQDQALSSELINNLKERAEHVMLIDLERNDLGRVCRPGSIEVNELMVVETYAHVHHIVSNVRGELRPDASPIDAIRAVFPGGTITGCPKVRCMEIIAELEQDGRGFYTGSMGYLGRDGGMDLNILIRSMIVDGRRVGFRTGAGIVADSVAEQEVIETADKARGLLLAVESHGRKRKHA